MKHEEFNIHACCVKWFDYQYKELSELLFHPANGGKRDAKEGARMKKLGVRAGVPDLFFSIPKLIQNDKYTIIIMGLYIEFKSENGRLTKSQLKFKEKAEKFGYKYIVCKDLEGFQQEIKDYIHSGA